MDKKTLVKNLHFLFAREYKENGMYTKVWLSQTVVLGYYKFSKYTLNLQTEIKKKLYFDEMKAVIDLLSEKANPELKMIKDVDIHHSDDGYYCRGNDLLVFQEPPYWEQ
jgi:hypothetical protein